MRRTLAGAAVLVAVLGASASGMVVDGSGQVTDWGITPFSQPNGSNLLTGGLVSTIQNDYSPIDFPNGVGHVPSYASLGERFDLEEMHVRLSDTAMQVLVVTSSAWSTTTGFGDGQVTWLLGDLFVEVDGALYGVVTQSANQGLAAGAVYPIASPGDVVLLQALPGSYLGNNALVANDYDGPATIRDIAGPWAVAAGVAGSPLGSAALDSGTFDYGGKEDGTFLLECTLDRALLGIGDDSTFTAKMTWGCGNDVIRVQAAGTPVPEPATAAFVVAGSALCYAHSRLKRRRRA